MSFSFDDKSKKTFCPLPWNHSYLNLDGSFQVCCTGQGFGNEIMMNSGEKATIQSGYSTNEVMNSDFMKMLRLDMLQGRWSSMCQRCEVAEKNNGVSRRNLEIKTHESKIEEMLESTLEDGTINYPVTSIDYRLGNVCNLQCRMCNPRSTKLWIEDWNKVVPQNEKVSPEVIESLKRYDWIDSEDLIKDFKDKSLHLEYIQFAGGEPLLVPQMSRILELCIESGNSKNIIITYTTNLTHLPKKVLDLWKYFKGVKILASIDAVGDLNHYIRYPSNWDEIDQNLKFIDENYESLNVIECILNTTVGALNVCSLDKIYNYLSTFNFVVGVPNLSNLQFPSYLATTVLPSPLKKLAIIQLTQLNKNYIQGVPDHQKYLVENINNVIQFMNSYDGYRTEEFQKFKKFQNDFDKIKGLNLLDYCREFEKFI